jgi:hypothetical protein
MILLIKSCTGHTSNSIFFTRGLLKSLIGICMHVGIQLEMSHVSFLGEFYRNRSDRRQISLWKLKDSHAWSIGISYQYLYTFPHAAGNRSRDFEVAYDYSTFVIMRLSQFNLSIEQTLLTWYYSLIVTWQRGSACQCGKGHLLLLCETGYPVDPKRSNRQKILKNWLNCRDLEMCQ